MQDELQSTSYDNYEEGSLEAKPFEELTEEERAMVMDFVVRLIFFEFLVESYFIDA